MTSSTSNFVEFPELTPASEAILDAYSNTNTPLNFRRGVAAALREAVYQAFPAHRSLSDGTPKHKILVIADNIHNVPPPTREQIADDIDFIREHSEAAVRKRLDRINAYIGMQQQELLNSTLIKDIAAINRPSVRQALGLT